MKKIFIIFILLIFSSTISVYATDTYKDALGKINTYKHNISQEKDSAKKANLQKDLKSYESSVDMKKLKEDYDKSPEAQWDITSQWFTISVNDISPGMWVQWTTTKENVNYLLGTIIQNLMIALWSLAILIMTIWAWYMLTYYGQDEQLSKWKKIFMSGVYAMITALSAYYIVSIVRYLLYFGDN